LSNTSDIIARLFIDPASRSTGWALFRGPTLLQSGTIAVDPKLSIFARLYALFRLYIKLGADLAIFKEVHIEQLPRNCHHYTHWSVGCLGAALYLSSIEVHADIPVQSWQKAVDWKGRQAALTPYKGKVRSEDELAAIGMGIYYTTKKV